MEVSGLGRSHARRRRDLVLCLSVMPDLIGDPVSLSFSRSKENDFGALMPTERLGERQPRPAIFSVFIVYWMLESERGASVPSREAYERAPFCFAKMRCELFESQVPVRG